MVRKTFQTNKRLHIFQSNILINLSSSGDSKNQMLFVQLHLWLCTSVAYIVLDCIYLSAYYYLFIYQQK